MASNRSIPAAPIEVDTDSPGTKRHCPSPNYAMQEGTPFTLEMFLNVIQPLIVKVGTVETRIAQVETAFTERMKEQVSLLTAVTNTQTQHSTDLANLQSKDKTNQETFQGNTHHHS